MAKIRGGDKMLSRIEQIKQNLSNASTVRIGFFASATYPDGTPVAMIAMIQDMGAPSVGIPPRPFFRNMIAEKSPGWPKAIRDTLKSTDYDAAKTLELVGQGVAGQLRQSIVDTNSPALLPATARRKGSSKPLVDTGHMLQSIDHEVV